MSSDFLNPAFFASAQPVERKLILTLDDGSQVEQVIYIRELPAIEMRKQVLAEQSGDEKRVTAALSALIARAVCDENGKSIITEDQAGKLKPVVAGDLKDLILEVNGLGKKPHSHGEAKSGSGTP